MQDLNLDLLKSTSNPHFELMVENGLKNAVIISLYTEPKRWAECISWKQDRSLSEVKTLSSDSLDEAEVIAHECLAWIIEEKIGSNIQIIPTAENQKLTLDVQISTNDGDKQWKL